LVDPSQYKLEGERIKPNPKDIAVHHSLILGRSNKALNDLNGYKSVLSSNKGYKTLEKNKKSYFEAIKLNQSLDHS
jgi:hypothetical protein